MQKTMGPTEWALLLLLSTLWGGSFFFVGVAEAALPIFTLVLGRVALAAIALNLLLLLSGRALPRGLRVWGNFTGMAMLNNVVPFTLFVWGQHHIASGLASILNATTPLWTVLVAHMLTADERITPLKALGVALGFGGAVAMLGGTLGGATSNLTAEGACLLAALSYAFAGVFGLRFRSMGIDPVTAAAGQVTCSTIILFPLAFAFDRPWTLPMPAPEVLGAVAGLALLSTALAYTIYFRLLARAGATNLLLVTFLIPVTAILLGVSVLGEVLTVGEVGGMALIGCGLAAIDGRLFARKRVRREGPDPAIYQGVDI